MFCIAYTSIMRKENFPRTITIRLTDEDMKKLEKIAQEKNLAPSAHKSGVTRLIRQIVEDYLKVNS